MDCRRRRTRHCLSGGMGTQNQRGIGTLLCRRPREIWTIGICAYASRPVDPRSTKAVELESENTEQGDTPKAPIEHPGHRGNSDTSLL